MHHSDVFTNPVVGFSQTCPGCIRNFVNLNAFSYQSASCKPKQKRLADALSFAQDIYRKKEQCRDESTKM